jgi:hypothetical protein
VSAHPFLRDAPPTPRRGASRLLAGLIIPLVKNVVSPGFIPKFFLLTAVLSVTLVCAVVTTSAEEKAGGPKDPVVPYTDPGGKEGDRQSWVRASLVKARGERIEGELQLSFTTLELDVIVDNNPAKKSVPLAEISSIEFVRWQGRKRRNNEYAFYHSEIRVTLVDKTAIQCKKNVRELNRLRLRNGDRTGSLYTYFLDYREKDAWRNSGQKEMNYPETNPHGATVVRINFIREPDAGPLDLFIKGLKKK